MATYPQAVSNEPRKAKVLEEIERDIEELVQKADSLCDRLNALAYRAVGKNDAPQAPVSPMTQPVSDCAANSLRARLTELRAKINRADQTAAGLEDFV